MTRSRSKRPFSREIKKKHFRVTIFGSARVKSGDKTYKMVYDLAKLIGQENIDIVTGGGPGLMEAASAGHEAGTKHNARPSHTLGLLIKMAHEQEPNEHLDIKKEFSRFSQRLDTFMALSNAVIVAPGGLGTSLELFYTWQLIQVKHICDIPIILLGDHYKGLIEWIKSKPLKQGFMKSSDLDNIFLAKNNKQAMHIVKEAYNHYKAGGKNICLNIKRYKIK